MPKTSLLLTAALAAFWSAPAAAETVEEMAAKFAARQSVLDISLSPSGTKIAYVAPEEPDKEMVYVVDVAGGIPRPVLETTEKNADMQGCWFITDTRLLCRVFYRNDKTYGVALGFTRMVAVGTDASNVMRLTPEDGPRSLGVTLQGGEVVALSSAKDPNRILMTHVWIPQRSTGAGAAGRRNGYGVDEVDVDTGKRSILEEPEENVGGWLADENGAVRLKVVRQWFASGYEKPERIYEYRPLGSKEWRELSRIQMDSQTWTGFLPNAVDSSLNVAYGFYTMNGRKALMKAALDGSGKTEIVLKRDDVDIDGLIRIGRDWRVVGATYATEKRTIEYIDEPLKKLARQFGDALPGKPLINIIDASADENKLLIVASSDTDPGMTYIYDKQKRELSEVLPIREQMRGRTMGTMTPVTFPAADGTTIPGYLTLPPGSDWKNLPAIVLPHGGPSARDEWGFDWLVQFLVSRGYAVLQPNYRGSEGYGDDWFGENGVKAWKTAIGDVNDAGHWMLKQGIANPDKLAIVGWSYGGYAALQSQVLEPRLFKAVVAIAPVADWGVLKEAQRRYTNYKLLKDFIGDGPHIKEGSPARNAEVFQAPVALFHGTMDMNVDIEQSRLMRDKLKDAGKKVEYTEFTDQTHSITNASDRTTLLVEVDKFLSETLGK